MNAEQTLLAALHADPGDRMAWQALADWLEESGQPDRAELTRLWLALRGGDRPDREDEARLAGLLRGGVRPCVPTLVNSVGMPLVLVPAGSFWIGSPDAEPERCSDEGPRHRREIERHFYLGAFPVTQAEYQRVTGTNPSHFCARGPGKREVKGLDTRSFPVEYVSWNDAVAFCAALSGLPAEKKAGRVYRLPSEAEWEYACRGAGATTTAFHLGNDFTAAHANFNGKMPYRGTEAGPHLGRPCPVGSYPPNALGLCDMHGNVYEWCADWFDEGAYSRSPPGPAPGRTYPYHVLRGGAWCERAQFCRAAYRTRNTADMRLNVNGLRVACEARGARTGR